MKRLFIITVLALAMNAVYCQTLQKGNLVGVHIITADLNPSVTMFQFRDFLINKLYPEFEKNDPDMKIFVAKGIRGENGDRLGVFFIFKDENVRDKYFKADGSPTALYNEIRRTMQPLYDELNKLGTFTTNYTDWVLQ